MRHASFITEQHPMTSPNPSAPIPISTISDLAIDDAEKHLRDVLMLAIQHTSEQAALIVMDTRSELSRALSEAYRRCLPNARFMDFDNVSPEAVHAAFNELSLIHI